MPPESQKAFSRSMKRYPGMAIMNPERLVTPRPPETSRTKPAVNWARRFVEESDSPSNLKEPVIVLRQWQNLVWEDNVPATIESRSGISESDKFRMISREQTAPSMNRKYDIETLDDENEYIASMDVPILVPLPANPKGAPRTATSASGSLRFKLHERSALLGNEKLEAVGQSQAKLSTPRAIPLALRAAAEGFGETIDPRHAAPAPPAAPATRTAADRYRRHEIMRGAGFSTILLSLDSHRAAYPTPSEALGPVRRNPRLQRAVQTVGAVGLPPPKLDSLFFAAQSLKRQWLLHGGAGLDSARGGLRDPKRPKLAADELASLEAGDAGEVRPALSSGPAPGAQHAWGVTGWTPPQPMPGRLLSPLFPQRSRATSGTGGEASPGEGSTSPRTPRDVLIEVSDSGDRNSAWRMPRSAGRATSDDERVPGPMPVPTPPTAVAAEDIAPGGAPAPDGATAATAVARIPPLALGRLKRLARHQARDGADGGSLSRRGVDLPPPATSRPAGRRELWGFRGPDAAATCRGPGGGAVRIPPNSAVLTALGLGASGLGPTADSPDRAVSRDSVGADLTDGGSREGGGSSRPATVRTGTGGGDRAAGLRALARKQAAAQGNRVLMKAAAELRTLDLPQAARSLAEAREVYARAELLAQKLPQLEELEARIRDAHQSLHDLRQSLQTPPPPPPPRPPRVEYSRAPGLARPEGLAEAWMTAPLPKLPVPEELSRGSGSAPGGGKRKGPSMMVPSSAPEGSERKLESGSRQESSGTLSDPNITVTVSDRNPTQGSDMGYGTDVGESNEVGRAPQIEGGAVVANRALVGVDASASLKGKDPLIQVKRKLAAASNLQAGSDLSAESRGSGNDSCLIDINVLEASINPGDKDPKGDVGNNQYSTYKASTIGAGEEGSETNESKGSICTVIPDQNNDASMALENPDHIANQGIDVDADHDSDLAESDSRQVSEEVGIDVSYDEQARLELDAFRQKKMACIINAYAKMSILRRQYTVLTAFSDLVQIPRVFPFFHDRQLLALQAQFRLNLARRSLQTTLQKQDLLKSIVRRMLSQEKYRIILLNSICLIAMIQRFSAAKMILHMKNSAQYLQSVFRSTCCRQVYAQTIVCAKALKLRCSCLHIRRQYCKIVIAGLNLSYLAKRSILQRLMHKKKKGAEVLQAWIRLSGCTSLHEMSGSSKVLTACVMRRISREKWLSMKEAGMVLSEVLLRANAYRKWKEQQPSGIRRRAANYLLQVSCARLYKNKYFAQLLLSKEISALESMIDQIRQEKLRQGQIARFQIPRAKEIRGALHELKQELALLVPDPLSVNWLAASMCRQREQKLSILQKQLQYQKELGRLEADLSAVESDSAKLESDLYQSNMLVLSNSLVMEHPDDHRLEQALQHEALKAFPEAILLLSQVINETKFRLFVLLKRAICFSHLNMRSDALKDLGSAIHEFPRDWRAYFFRALLFVQMNRADDGLEDLSKTIQLNPSLSVAYVLKANLAFEDERYTDAIMDLNVAAKLRFEDPGLYILRGKAYRKLGKLLLASHDFERAVVIHVERIAHTQGKDQVEMKARLRAMRYQCNDNMLIDLCICFLETENSGAALNIFTSILGADSSRSIAHALIGHVKSFQGDFEGAEKCIERAVLEDPLNSNVLLFRALFFRSIDPLSSQQDLRQSLELDETNCRASFVMGKLCESQQDWQGALRAYRSAMSESYDDDRLLESTMRYSKISLQLAGADTILRAAAFKRMTLASVKHAPALEPLVSLARSFARFGEYSKALKAVCRAIHMFPRETSLYTLRSRLLTESAHLREGNRDSLRSLFLQDTKNHLTCKRIAQIKIKLGMNLEAKKYLEDLLAQNPRNADFECLLGSVYFNLGNVKQAFNHLSEAIRIEPFSGENFGSRAKVYAHQRDFPKAIADYDNALKANSCERDFFYGRAVCFFESGKNDEALQDLHAVIALDPIHTHARLLRGMLLEQNGQRSLACEDYSQALEYLHKQNQRRARGYIESSENAQQSTQHLYLLCIRRGALLSRRKEYAAAIQDYNEALGIDPNCEIALLQRGNAYHQHGYFGSACADYSKCLVLDPTNELARKNRALANLAQRKWTNSLNDFNCIPEGKRDAKTWLCLVDCYRGLKDVRKALIAAEQALLLASNSMSVHGFLGLNKLLTKCLVLKGDVEEDAFPRSKATLKTLTRAVHMLPDSNFARLKLAFALFGRGSLRAAAAQLKVVTTTEPNNSMAAELAAVIHAELGNLHVAYGRLDSLIFKETSVAGRAELINSRGVLLQRLQDLPHAEHDFWRSSKMNPERGDTLYNLGCLHMQREHWNLARMAFSQAVKATPTNDLALLNRSVVLFQLGKADLAIADLDKALDITPDLGQAYLNRATIKLTLGNRVEAEEDLNKAVQLLNPDSLFASQDLSAIECVCHTRHIINRGQGRSIDSLTEYLTLQDISDRNTLDLTSVEASEQIPAERSLWFECLTGKKIL